MVTKNDIENRQSLAEITESRKLTSLERGASEIEQLAERVETRRATRIPTIFPVRLAFLRECQKVAKESDWNSSKIHKDDLIKLRDEVQEKVSTISVESASRKFFSWFGFHDKNAMLLEVYNRALERVDEIEGDFLWYKDFTFDNTRLVSRWPWMRVPWMIPFLVIFGFYLFTPIFFCLIVNDRQVCPTDPTDKDRWWYGWVTAIYFASTTMSTVGYGDITVEKDKKWSVFVGSMYMILAIIVAITAFSKAAEGAYSMTFTKLNDLTENVLMKIGGHHSEKKMLYDHMRRIKFIKMTEIVLQVGLLVFVGMCITRGFIRNAATPDSDQDWDWMTSFYWTIQTVTTIGYGDLAQTFEMRWFKIVFLAFSTVFVGNAFGKLAHLSQELDEVKKHYVWQRREVSKRMIDEMQAYEHDDKVDQYEFVISSLLMLDKISSKDITPIMDKFRLLAGEKGYIQMAQTNKGSTTTSVADTSGSYQSEDFFQDLNILDE